MCTSKNAVPELRHSFSVNSVTVHNAGLNPPDQRAPLEGAIGGAALQPNGAERPFKPTSRTCVTTGAAVCPNVVTSHTRHATLDGALRSDGVATATCQVNNVARPDQNHIPVGLLL